MDMIPCTPNPECKYFNHQQGCKPDKHHPISKSFRKGKGDAVIEASELTAYYVCRRVHEETEARTTPVEITTSEAHRINETKAEWLPECVVAQRMLAESIALEFIEGGNGR